ncbi:MAG: response regulator [Caldilinea sp. CFX5]|nr:response regulator [Caldilinea sp. CFX5]
MKKFNAFLESFLLRQNAVAVPRVLLLIIPMVILLLTMLGVALQLNRQFADQQQIALYRFSHGVVRHTAQLQREHLRLQALLMSSTEYFVRAELQAQRDLVWSRIRILENPRHLEDTSQDTKALLLAYRRQWEALQPALAQWLADAPPQAQPAELIANMEDAEKLLNEMVSVGHHGFEDQLLAWADSAQQLNGLLTSASITVMLMIVLTTYVIYQFFRVQVRIAEGLRHSEQRLRTILDTIPDAVFRLTQDYVFTDIKPPKNFVIPFAAEKLIGKHIAEIFPANTVKSIVAPIQNALATSQEQLTEHQFYDETSKSFRSFEARILPTGSAEVQVILRDITVDKQQEEATRQAQKLESLGILAGGIAHDFNNLLTGILGQASLAKQKLARSLPASDNIDKAILSAERAADLTRQLLAYAGKGKFQITQLDLNQLIRDTTSLMQVALPSQAQLHLALDEQLPLIEADRGQLQQIVMNLFINGVEALGEKGGAIHIVTHYRQITTADIHQSYVIGAVTPGPYVVLQITDSGIGMEQSVLSRIFDPFFSTKPKGHGLGLSATLGIIRTHQGALQVQSQPGHGTNFTIFLPALPPQQVELAAIAAIPLPPQEERPLVLVIDDEETLREVAHDVLAEDHFKVVTAASGPEGIEQFRRLQKQVGVVLLDMKMPGMNGKQTYQVLRQIEPAVKVVFTSGYSETEVNTQLDNGLAVPFLAKPYTAESLVQHVRQMLDSRESTVLSPQS